MRKRPGLSTILPLVLSLLGVAAMAAERSPSCTSDGLPAPTMLNERFINADCADCWRGPAETVSGDSAETVALDWIAPGPLGDQGALYAAARIDALARLNALGRVLPPRTGSRTATVVGSGAVGAPRLRVAHGLPVGNYLGTSIEWSHASPGRWHAWLLMVEELPAGTAGSPVARRLVRNSLQLDWTVPASSTGAAPVRLSELRPTQIPAGAQADRLAVVGFVEAATPDSDETASSLMALARSRCEAQP